MDAIVEKAPRKGAMLSELLISPPEMWTVHFNLTGTSPLMIARFSEKAQHAIREKQEAGSVAKSKKNRSARDFENDFEQARHRSTEGWDGVNAASFRNAAIRACSAAGFVMTKAKLAIFCEADGYDVVDGVPLVRIHSETPPVMTVMPVRNASGVMDLRSRPRWDQWTMDVRIRFDADILTGQDVVNLLMRVGLQVGIGEGRPYGTQGNGIGFGLFKISGAKIDKQPTDEFLASFQ